MKLLMRVAFLLVGLGAGLMAGLLLPTEPRLKLSRQLADGIGKVIAGMPEG